MGGGDQRSGGPAEGDGDQIETQRTVNVLPTYSKYPNNKIIGDYEKYAFHFTKKVYRLFGQPNIVTTSINAVPPVSR